MLSDVLSEGVRGSQWLEVVVCIGLVEKGQMSSRQSVKVEQKVSVAILTLKSENWVCEGGGNVTMEDSVWRTESADCI